MSEAELAEIKARAEELVGDAEPELTPDQTYQDIQALIAAVRRFQATVTVITFAAVRRLQAIIRKAHGLGSRSRHPAPTPLGRGKRSNEQPARRS